MRAIVPSSFMTSQMTAAGIEPGKSREIDGGFRVTGADQDAAFARDEREDVAGRDDVAGALGRIDGGRDRARTVERRDAGRDAFARLDRLREGGAVARAVRAHHEFELQLVRARLRQRRDR